MGNFWQLFHFSGQKNIFYPPILLFLCQKMCLGDVHITPNFFTEKKFSRRKMTKNVIFGTYV